METLIWKRGYPQCEGFFFYRVNMSEPPEVIECYLGGRNGGQFKYGWSDPKLLLGKRMHDPAAVAADELGGFYLIPDGKKDPVPIVLIENAQKARKPKKKTADSDEPLADVSHS